MFQSIWMLLTGMGRELDALNATLGRILGLLVGLQAQLTQLAQQLAQLAQTVAANQQALQIALSKIQATLNPPPAASLVIKLGGMIPGENMLKVADTGSVVATLEADDALGNAGASLDVVPAWTASDPTLATLNVAADGMSAVAVLSGKLGTFTLSVSASAGGNPLSATSDSIQVAPGAAALLKLTVNAAAAPSA